MVALRNNLRPAVEADCSGLSFLKLSCTILIIGVFWMVVQLHAYVVWLRAGEKALLLFAMIVSCIGIFLTDRLPSNVHQKNRKIVQLYWVFTLSVITLLVIYLAISEPSPLSVLFPDLFYRGPGSTRITDRRSCDHFSNPRAIWWCIGGDPHRDDFPTSSDLYNILLHRMFMCPLYVIHLLCVW